MSQEHEEERLVRIEAKLDTVADAQSRIVEELTEVMRTMQTELLRGFAAFAEGMNIRLTKVEKSQTLLDESTSGRLRIIEERMRQIEQRLSLQ